MLPRRRSPHPADAHAGEPDVRRGDHASDGTILTFGSKDAGVVTSAAAPPDAATTIGMGYMRKEGNGLGTQLEWPGRSARVLQS